MKNKSVTVNPVMTPLKRLGTFSALDRLKTFYKKKFVSDFESLNAMKVFDDLVIKEVN
jgi:hypothetical protein